MPQVENHINIRLRRAATELVVSASPSEWQVEREHRIGPSTHSRPVRYVHVTLFITYGMMKLAP